MIQRLTPSPLSEKIYKYNSKLNFLINNRKMAQFLKFKFLLNLNGVQFYKEMPKFGYLKKGERVRIEFEWLRKLVEKMIKF